MTSISLAQAITISRTTGYQSHNCAVCGEWREALPVDGVDDVESFDLRFPLDMPYSSGGAFIEEKVVTLCHVCLRQLEEAAYAALRDRIPTEEA